MNGEQLLGQLGLTEDSLVAEAAESERKRPAWIRCLYVHVGKWEWV